MLALLKGIVLYHLYWGVTAGIVVGGGKVLKLPEELYRKLVHLCAVFSIFPAVLTVPTWQQAALICLLFMVEAWFGAKHTNLEKNVGVHERQQGEQQKSMLLLMSTYIFLIAVGWGYFHQKWIPILSVVAWGVGDACAALIGKKFGKHKIYGKKSLEGSMAMFTVSFLSVTAFYRYHSALSEWWLIALVAFWVALFSTIAELISKSGTDTFFCPASALAGFAILMVNAGTI